MSLALTSVVLFTICHRRTVDLLVNEVICSLETRRTLNIAIPKLRLKSKIVGALKIDNVKSSNHPVLIGLIKHEVLGTCDGLFFLKLIISQLIKNENNCLLLPYLLD